MTTSNLPTPTSDAIAHSDKLKDHLIDMIHQNSGSISFADFMHHTLYAPGLGYYAAGSRKFGKDGDFITAPELSPLFSQCLAKQCKEVLIELQGGELLEIGAGTGVMAADLLLALEKENSLPSRYLILEVSAELQQRQRETVKNKAPHLLAHVEWLSNLPQNFSGMILANEMLDAMPVHVFSQTEEGVLERCITIKEGELAWAENPADLDLQKNIEKLQVSSPYTSEINLALPSFILDISRCLKKGVALFIDYGFPQKEYYHHERSEGTLMCHYRHHSHPDPLLYLGLQDITAHVDFTAVAQAAVDNGLDIVGYTNQAGFLLSAGLLESASSELEKVRLQNKHAINMLTSPSEMGELFKVIALGKEYEEELLGFRMNDQSHRL
jgi:SAM-dependent MidA family methyltransferase